MNSLGWDRTSIADLQARKRWALNGGPFGSKLVSKDYLNIGVPVIRGVNLPLDKRFNMDDFVFVSEEKANELLSNNAHPGDVIFTQRGTLGQVGIIPINSPHPRFVISQSQMKMTVDTSRVNATWLYYCFRNPLNQQELINRASSSGVPHINLAVLREFEIFLPPLPIQHNIASILSAYDDLIDNNTRRIAILEEMARRIYEEWFVHFRFPGHEKVKMVDSELGKIPEGWKVTHLSNLVDPQYGYTESTQDKPIGPKFLRGMDINKQSYIDWSQVPYCPISDSEFQKYKLGIGDVIVIRMADPGKIGIVEKQVDAVFASYLVRLKIRDTRLTPYYLFYFLTGECYQDYISGASTGTTRKSASAPVITGINLSLPPASLIDNFEKHVIPLRKLINVLIDKNSYLRTTRDFLLPKLISGEIDVSKLPEPEEAAA